MQGWLEALVPTVLLRGLSPGLASVLMAAPPKRVARAQLKKIYVLDDAGDMAGEDTIDPDCPIDYDDFLRALPETGIGDRESLFVGEYVFTAFQSGKFVFVLLSRGQLAPEDFDWTALLLTAADSHLAKAASRPPPVRPPGAKAAPPPPGDKVLAEKEVRLNAQEAELAKLEVRLKADEANLRGRAEELERQKSRLTALADFVDQAQQGVLRSAAKAAKSLELTEELTAGTKASVQEDHRKDLAAARHGFEEDVRSLRESNEALTGQVREASHRAAGLEAALREANEALERERADAAAKEAEAVKMRETIETRVQELSQRFAAMAKERIVMSHRGPAEPSEATNQTIDAEKAALSKERKFLQRRAIELLDREEQIRDRETKLGEKEELLRKRGEEVAAREAAVQKREEVSSKVSVPPPIPASAAAEVDEARRDIERRGKSNQQKDFELLDREEKLRKRAAEIEAMEARLAGKPVAK